MSNAVDHEPMRFGFYTDTFMYRSEVFFYRQAVGMPTAKVQVLARQGALLDEFPVDDLFLIDEFRHLPTRLRLAVERRLDRTTTSLTQMRRYAVRRLTRHLAVHPVDLLYTMFGWHAVQLLDILDAMKRPVPLVYFAGGSDVTSASAFGDIYLERLGTVWDHASLIIATSSFVADRLVELGAPAQRIEQLYLGVDVADLSQTCSRSHDDEFRLIAVSRLSKVKGIEHTIRAFDEVHRYLPNARLDVIGDGEEREELERLVNVLGLDDRIVFHGSRPNSYISRWMSDADVFVQHSVRTPEGREEAMGVSVLEASAHGLPVVVTRSGGIPEGVKDGVTGILVDPGDENGMARAIIDLARDPELRQRMGAAGRDHMIRNFDVRKQNAKLEAMLTEVALEHRRKHG